MNASGGYFFQMLPKRRTTEHTQFQKELKTKHNPYSKLFWLFIFKKEKIIQGRKNVNVVCIDLVSWVGRKQEFDQSNYIL